MLSFVNILILIAFCFFIIKSFKQSLILITSTFFLIAQWGSGFGEVRMFPALILFSLVIFLIKISRHEIVLKYKYPKTFLLGSVFVAICYLITAVHAKRGDLATTIVNLICYFVFPFMLWHCLDTEKRLRKLLKYLKVLFLIAAVYTVIEVLLGSNPLNVYAINLGLLGGTHMDSEGGSIRFGFVRCFSIFPYVSAMGFWATYSFLLFYFSKYVYKQYNQKKLLILLIMMPVCSILSGTRSVILTFFLCFALLFLDKRLYKSSLFKYVVLGVFVAAFFLMPFIDSLINSIVDTQSVGGSSQELRLNQLEIAYMYMQQSPIWGNGRLYTWNYAIPNTPALMGAESIWFQLMIDYGIMGCLSFIVLLLCVGYELQKRDRFLLLFPLAFLVSKSLSAIIGVDFNALLVFSLILIKMNQYSINISKL